MHMLRIVTRARVPHSCRAYHTRRQVEQVSNRNPNHFYDVGKCRAAPYASATRKLQLLCTTSGEHFHRSQLSEAMLHRAAHGTVLWRGGSLVCVRLPDNSLGRVAIGELLQLATEHLRSRPTLVRGKSCASISTHFAAMGLHLDLYSQSATPHSSRAGYEVRDAAIYCRLRAYYNKHLHPLMSKYLTVWFHDLWAWLGEHGVLLHVQQVTAVTIGRDFQPVSHIDADFGPTVLVCLHEGEGPMRGGDFSFSDDGHVIELHHGDVLVYNPEAVHGTTEFEFAGAADGCLMVAFFCSSKTLEACVVKSVLPSINKEA